jgi:hypothetical protein
MEGDGCRMSEFVRWNRTLLQHERAGISDLMAKNPAYLGEQARKGLMHDLSDIDYCLAELGRQENDDASAERA